MKQIIKDVLEDMSNGQVNLGSSAARELVSTTISAALKAKGTYTEYSEGENFRQRTQSQWVCSICGESTANVEYDYIGSNFNHLACELKTDGYKEEYITLTTEKNKTDDDIEHDIGGPPTAFEDPILIQGSEEISGMYLDDEVEGWEKIVQDDVRNFTEELINDPSRGYIYESPDGGKTVYRRGLGSKTRELVEDWEAEKNKIEGRANK
ncbi:MAG: hypothetical protein H8E03_00405 [Pelagibacteraceae bacterium]|nr:hypothetical protein [Pelagibacteraceae bacterium]